MSHVLSAIDPAQLCLATLRMMRHELARLSNSIAIDGKANCKAVHQQLTYLHRNLQYNNKMNAQCELSEKHARILKTIQTIDAQ